MTTWAYMRLQIPEVSLDEKLAELGKQCWELVCFFPGAVYSNDGYGLVYLFKRPGPPSDPAFGRL